MTKESEPIQIGKAKVSLYVCIQSPVLLNFFDIMYLQPVSRADREVISRLRNCVLALAEHKMMLFDTSILYTYEASLKFPVSWCVLIIIA